jgi:hypothetical protein
VSIPRDPLWPMTGDGASRLEKGFRRCLITLLAPLDIDSVAVTIHRPVEGGPAPFPSEERLVYIPARPASPHLGFRSLSLSMGASCASHTRTASGGKTIPGAKNLSGRARGLNLSRTRHSTQGTRWQEGSGGGCSTSWSAQ